MSDVDGVLDLIDGALRDDTVSNDAMRSVPAEDRTEVRRPPQIVTGVGRLLVGPIDADPRDSSQFTDVTEYADIPVGGHLDGDHFGPFQREVGHHRREAFRLLRPGAEPPVMRGPDIVGTHADEIVQVRTPDLNLRGLPHVNLPDLPRPDLTPVAEAVEALRRLGHEVDVVMGALSVEMRHVGGHVHMHAVQPVWLRKRDHGPVVEEDPRERALRLRRERNTGPQADPHRHRGL